MNVCRIYTNEWGGFKSFWESTKFANIFLFFLFHIFLFYFLLFLQYNLLFGYIVPYLFSSFYFLSLSLFYFLIFLSYNYFFPVRNSLSSFSAFFFFLFHLIIFLFYRFFPYNYLFVYLSSPSYLLSLSLLYVLIFLSCNYFSLYIRLYLPFLLSSFSI